MPLCAVKAQHIGRRYRHQREEHSRNILSAKGELGKKALYAPIFGFFFAFALKGIRNFDAIDGTDLEGSNDIPGGKVAPTFIPRKMVLENSAQGSNFVH
jgi:hypothetical protein